MKQNTIINSGVLSLLSELGHTDTIAIADCGLPIPKGVKVIDISVTAGIPSFLDVLRTVAEELVVESIVVAKEIDEKNPKILADMCSILGEMPVEKIPHEELKRRVASAKCVIRTGETSSYANVLLVGGVNF